METFNYPFIYFLDAFYKYQYSYRFWIDYVRIQFVFVVIDSSISDVFLATKCNRAEVALAKLRENKNGFDIVISDVHMPDMDGFKLLEHIGLEMDLPVISKLPVSFVVSCIDIFNLDRLH